MSTQSLPSTQKREIVSVNPATGEELGRVPLMNASEVSAAVSRARKAQQSWSRLSYRARAEYVLRAREIVPVQVDDVAGLISRETGKPPAEATSMEVVPTLDLMYYFARNTETL